MPNINGTSGDDTIDVTNDNGTLNGTPQGTPINNIRARGGDDTVTVTDSTISGSVRGNAGEDEITISGSVVSGLVNSGSDADTVTIFGSAVGNIRLGGGDDTLNFTSSTVSGSVRGGGGNDVMNLPTGTVVTDSTFGTFTIGLGSSYSLSSGTFTLPSGSTVTYSSFDSGTGIPCFTRDTRIQSHDGPKKVQSLQPADQLVTLHNGPQGIRWIGRRHFDLRALKANPKLRPIRIVAGALGGGLPDRDLLVSRQHRMLVQSRIAERMFGVTEVLIPAIKLIRMPGIFIDRSVTSVEYFHILLDRHEVVFAEGAPTESLFAGPEALKSIGAEDRAEVLAIFPELTGMDVTPRPARFIPPNILQRRLINRHHKNNKPLLTTADIGQGQKSPARQISRQSDTPVRAACPDAIVTRRKQTTSATANARSPRRSTA